MRVVRVIKGLLFVILGCVVFGFATKYLWNWLMPGLFGLHTITYWQAIGLLVLSKILFGGVHKHGGRGGWNRRREWKQRMKQRWEHMTPEEKERFKAGVKGRWGCGFGKDGRGFGRHDFEVEFDGRDFGARGFGGREPGERGPRTGEEPVSEKGTV